MPPASTGTTVPSIVLHKNGVIKIAPTVVAVVINTLSATFPLAMYVQRLLACPPLMLPTSTIPANSPASKPNALPRPSANSGIMP
jgi:hypothetical protein